ncbi:UDP-N-acetylmuramyl pentapeptide phosphotransferase/UDP-N-acetylglucosamine-1-phosphate transferase [Massilia aurea]|uniref:UDP-N-acetylmuramyl pentapeptide phosphotransferase/UDP-N-acetylglucosamine-1-phosphate transferase n=1 Tax=Massilia aurea TaxID=373040 RepID=A0A7W9WVA5_9BURK|nr:glycosyltransferase [Massilia aurea]MBB6131899.1 UDP-N-acetylmuramyl pentapeptide phosphotransferase/UDP-N-acetylglucosamine-1-phosphate transferase [Massilia aurea]
MVSRTGGVAMVAGVLAVPAYGGLMGYRLALQTETNALILLLLLAALPAFLAGIIEDLTKQVSVRLRLCAILTSAVLAAWLAEAHLPRLDIWALDGVLHWLPVSFAVTAFAVAGVSNAINIVDGFNGVAGGTIVVILAGAGFLAWQAGDPIVTLLALAGIGATIGFLLLNYPTGRLFMGDGGAYFIGFWAAEVAVLTIVRNPGINAWQILAIYAYPVIEVLFSMYRRKILRSALVGAPDRLHLHSLFYRRVACNKIRIARYTWRRNAGVACFVTAWLSAATIAAVLLGDTVPAAVALVLAQMVVYVAVYMRLVRGHWGRCRHPAVILGLRPQPRSEAI